MKIIALNKRANYEYFILDKFVAGISLVGSEVKSIRNGNVSIVDTYVTVRNDEAYVINMFVKQYEFTAHYVSEERRARKLLLRKNEIKEIAEAIKQKGLTVVPLKIFLDKHLVKLEIAVCKGKQLHDKRESIKARDLKRDIARDIKSIK